jgi:3-keto-5-aminohexanoate cleavage enzyme
MSHKEDLVNEPVLIAVAPSIPPYMRGGLPPLDLSPEGIASEVVRAWNAGASIAHLHVWDEEGTPTQDTAAFVRTIRLIREQCDILIEGSTGGFNELTPAQRSVALQTDIELASLNPGSVNYDEGVYINPPDAIAYWVQEMHHRGIKPDAAIFEAGMIANTLRLAAEGWIDTPQLYAFVLGQPGAMPATARNLCFLRDSIPADALWGAIGHGGHDVRIAVMAMSMGGHVRAGFEDNPFYRPGQPATHNAQLIDRLVRVAKELGREVASPPEARKVLGVAATQR